MRPARELQRFNGTKWEPCEIPPNTPAVIAYPVMLSDWMQLCRWLNRRYGQKQYRSAPKKEA